MKLGFFFTLMLINITVWSQVTSYGSFKVEDQEIIYQKIFTHDSITVEKLAAYYTTLPYISNLQANDGGIELDMNDVVVDYKKFQFSQVSTPPIIQTGKYSG